MLKDSEFLKIITYVPVSHAEKLRKAMGDAGAGLLGNYSHCSGSIKCVGRFIPLAGAKPAIGQVGVLEEVSEEIIEVLCHKDKVEEVVRAIKKVHPYEQPAIDIIPRLEL